MAPIDPYQLLKALSPLLDVNGGLNNEDNAKSFISLMKDSNRLVSRCVYVNILKATQKATLFDVFLEAGVWNILNTWLQEAKDSQNMPFLIELLGLYSLLPVTVDVLKKNKAAKTIKQLCKSDSPDMKTLATSIVDNWMKTIRDKTAQNGDNSEKVRDKPNKMSETVAIGDKSNRQKLNDDETIEMSQLNRGSNAIITNDKSVISKKTAVQSNSKTLEKNSINSIQSVVENDHEEIANSDKYTTVDRKHKKEHVDKVMRSAENNVRKLSLEKRPSRVGENMDTDNENNVRKLSLEKRPSRVGENMDTDNDNNVRKLSLEKRPSRVGENMDTDKAETSPAEKKRKKQHLLHHQTKDSHDHLKSHKYNNEQTTSRQIVDITTNQSAQVSRDRRTSGSKDNERIPISVSKDNERTPIKLIISKGQVQNAVKTSSQIDHSRAKTVKVRPQKFRSTGLQDSTPLPNSTSDSRNVPPKRSSQPQKSDRTSEPPEKKTRPSVNTTLAMTTAGQQSSSVASLSTQLSPTDGVTSKSSKVEIKESSGFMDALIATPALPSFKKKKKVRLSTSPTTAHMPALVIATTCSSQVTSHQSPLTSPSHKKLPQVPSFYRDTLETPEVVESEPPPTSQRCRSPSPPRLIQQPPIPEYHPTQIEKTVKLESYSTVSSVETTITDKTPNVSKRRKSVSWPAEQNLKQIFYFEMDDSERENVNKTRDFAEMKRYEAQVERRTLENSKRMSNDHMSEEIAWYPPNIVDNVNSLVEDGKESLEKNVQMKRELSVLQALYFTKNMLPDSPAEADLEVADKSDPRTIPITDESLLTNEPVHNYDNTDVNSAPKPDVNPAPVILPRNVMQPPPNTVVPMLPSGAMIAPPPPPPPFMPHTPLPPDINHLLSSLSQGNFDPSIPSMAGGLQFMTSLLNSEHPPTDDNTRNILQLLEPYKPQLLGYMAQMSGYNQMYNQSLNMFNPVMHAMGFAPTMMPPRPQMPILPQNDDWSGDWSGDMRGGPAFMRKRGRGFGGNRGPLRGGRGPGLRMRLPDWKRICYNFNSPGGCKFGDDCKYYHPSHGPS